MKKNPVLVIDGVLIENNKVLLVKRDIEPFKNFWVLPGGHVECGERVEEALIREMKEELGIEVKIKKLIGIFSDPKRDPRGCSVSAAFLIEKAEKREISLNFEAKEWRFFDLNNLPSKIGFDHFEIIREARKLI